MKSIILATITLLLLSCNNSEHKNTNQITTTQSPVEGIQEGDLIFHTSQSSQSKAIQIATNSKYSHMGILYQQGGKWYVFEAVQPVSITSFKSWVERGEGQHYVVKRLKDNAALLTKEGILKMKQIGKKYLGKDYDLQFQWSDEKIYCSELVWKIYKEAFNIEIGQLQRFGDFDLSNEIVQQKVQERYQNDLPKEELVITPDQMFNADNLITVKVQ